MADPIRFTRVYEDMTGITYPADAGVAQLAIRVMNRVCANPQAPFPYKLRFDLDDGSQVTVRPKRQRAS